MTTRSAGPKNILSEPFTKMPRATLNADIFTPALAENLDLRHCVLNYKHHLEKTYNCGFAYYDSLKRKPKIFFKKSKQREDEKPKADPCIALTDQVTEIMKELGFEKNKLEMNSNIEGRQVIERTYLAFQKKLENETVLVEVRISGSLCINDHFGPLVRILPIISLQK